MRKTLYFIMAVAAAACVLAGCGKEPLPDSGGNGSGTGEPDTDNPAVEEPMYSIGDWYEKGFLKGVVFNVDETGEHGYIMATDEIVTVWSYVNENVMYGMPAPNGDYNCALIREMDNWNDNYPGFAWADSKNVLGLNNWYVPSSQEMALIYAAFKGHVPDGAEDENAIVSSRAEGSSGMTEEECMAWFNSCLTSHGGVPLDDVLYWTSGELGPQIAYAFDMATGTNTLEQEKIYKTKEYPFRAISRF